MFNKFIVFFIFIANLVSQNNDTVYMPTKWISALTVGYQGIHQTGGSIHLNLRYNELYAIEIGYGSDFLNSSSVSLKYFINEGNNQFYISLGYAFFSLQQKKEYLFEINTVHSSIGYHSTFKNKWIVGQEISLVKYLNQNFKLPNKSYKESYPLNEKIYFEIGLYIGYQLNWTK
jgi:hypothetical protein